MAKYSKGAVKKVEEAMHEMKRGKLKSGRSGKKVTSRKQAIAIGLSEARERGAKVPSKASKPGGRRTKAAKKGTKKSASKSTAKKSAPRKSASKSTGRKPASRSTGRKSASTSTSHGSRSRNTVGKSTGRKSAARRSR